MGLRFDVLTLFPEMIESYCSLALLGRGVKNGIIEVHTTNPRDFTQINTEEWMILPTAALQVW